jgi:hypothetical protein
LTPDKWDAAAQQYSIAEMISEIAAYDRYISSHPSPDRALMASELERELLELRRYNLAARRSPDLDERFQARMALVYAAQIYRELRARHMENQAAA